MSPINSKNSSERADHIVDYDPWENLRHFTDARIGLGRCGTSLPLKEVLDFKLAHARARDAVFTPMETVRLQEELAELGIESLCLSSAVCSRAEYLSRPDLGRKLSEESHKILENTETKEQDFDICIVVGDGLSSKAIHENGVPLISALVKLLEKTPLRLAPISFVENSRVATGDEIAPYFGAKVTVMLIGERPGLSSPNSLGIYMTYGAKPGTTDEARNCISNVRERGLSIKDAAEKLCYLMENALLEGKSGVELKDKMPSNYLPFKELRCLE